MARGAPATVPPRAAIAQHALIAGLAPSPARGALSCARAIDAGLREGGRPPSDLCPLEQPAAGGLAEMLEQAGYDERMRLARAVVVLSPLLDPAALAGSVAFELATRARQAGVPAYAVTGENRLSAFEQRVLDLQLLLQASSPSQLRAAGAALSRVI